MNEGNQPGRSADLSKTGEKIMLTRFLSQPICGPGSRDEWSR
jgi:hypothetical protein